jgi:ATP-dependent Clp protease adapter protein ClpS
MSQPPADRPQMPRLPGGVPPQPEISAAQGPRQVPRYKVVLHRDPRHDLMFVVRSVMELTRFPREEATHKMWEAYHGGRSILLITYLERAELYADQFAGKGLTVTVEPA